MPTYGGGYDYKAAATRYNQYCARLRAKYPHLTKNEVKRIAERKGYRR